MAADTADGNPGSASGDDEHRGIQHPAASGSNYGDTEGPVYKALSNEVDKSQKEIDLVKERREALNSQKRQIAQDLRNMEKKRARLKKKALNLTTPDIVQLLVIRTKEKEIREQAAARRQARQT